MTAWLTLAKGLDRWEEDRRGSYRYKAQGALWLMLWPGEELSPTFSEPLVVLKPHVAEWCFENIRAYRIVEHVPDGRHGPEEEDSWRIEFQHESDKFMFVAMWGEK